MDASHCSKLQVLICCKRCFSQGLHCVKTPLLESMLKSHNVPKLPTYKDAYVGNVCPSESLKQQLSMNLRQAC